MGNDIIRHKYAMCSTFFLCRNVSSLDQKRDKILNAMTLSVGLRYVVDCNQILVFWG